MNELVEIINIEKLNECSVLQKVKINLPLGKVVKGFYHGNSLIFKKLSLPTDIKGYRQMRKERIDLTYPKREDTLPVIDSTTSAREIGAIYAIYFVEDRKSMSLSVIVKEGHEPKYIIEPLTPTNNQFRYGRKNEY